MKDHFKDKATNWDSGDIRVNNAKTIAEAIEKAIPLNKDMEIVDFGVGTGLLGFSIAPKVKQVYGVDTSAKMLEQLQEKNTPELAIKTYHQDIIKEPIKQQFDGLISSMTLHHVKDLDAFFSTISKNIKTNGFIAIADLESEDGTFHSDNTGVHHFGFDAQSLRELVQKHGFEDVKIENINTIQKPHNNFGVFLLTAKKS